MMTESATVAPEGKRYKYYGLEYKMSVGEIAKLCEVSLRTMKDILKLHSMGYTDHMTAGWTIKQCFNHAGVGRPRKAAPSQKSIDEFKAVIIYYREQMDDAMYEIKRLRELVFDLGVDPDG